MSMTPLKIGFVPLMDAALLIIAREEGFAAGERLDIELVREGSWASVRDKLNAGLFDAAHMLAPAAIASTLGLGHFRSPLISPVALSLDGNAITVSNALARRLEDAMSEQSGSPQSSARAMARLIGERKARSEPPYTIGVVFGYSCHLYQVRAWLQLGGVDPERDVSFVVIPPPLMVESLAAGHLDLFCAGAPWNRLAETGGAGQVLMSCRAIMPGCLEKLLVMRADRERAEWLPGLVRAVMKAAAFAADPANRAILARHLSRPDYVGAPKELMEQILDSSLQTLADKPGEPWIRFDPDATIPSTARLANVLALMRDAGQAPDDPASSRSVEAIMRPDLHEAALSRDCV